MGFSGVRAKCGGQATLAVLLLFPPSKLENQMAVGQKETLGTRDHGFYLFFVLQTGFLGYPFLTHRQIRLSKWTVL